MNGIIVLDKPQGITSHGVCLRVKKILGVKKTGHIGTLDPMATGVLPVCLNEGTKLAQFLLEGEKEYHAVMELGRETDTHDSQGKTLRKIDPGNVDLSRLESTVTGFSGEYFQVPPMYSALKHKGTPLYKLARKGKTIARPARRSEIRIISILETAIPHVRLRIVCSAGTYIRTLCHDIGQMLGCGAHMAGLKRVRTGPFHIDNAISIEEVAGFFNENRLGGQVISLCDALHDMPSAYVDSRIEQKIRNGGSLSLADCRPPVSASAGRGSRIKVISREHKTLIAVAERSEGRMSEAVSSSEPSSPVWKTRRVFAHDDGAREHTSQQCCACHG